MCGIVAIISNHNKEDLGSLIGSGLYQLQNRGDHSTGIATIKRLNISRREYRRLRNIAVEESVEDFNSLEVIRGKGTVGRVFDEENIKKLTGFMGVGQVRYPTSGYTIKNKESLSEEELQKEILSSIQPLQSKWNKIAMVHNGDINNYHEIMNSFAKQGLKRGTSNDLEAILSVFTEEFFDLSENMSKEERVMRSVKKVFEQIQGTYSVAGIINNVGLVVFRDSEGRRPLHYGVRKDDKGKITDYGFASETVALDKMLLKGTSDDFINDKNVYKEVKPGEAIFISKDFEFFREQITPSNSKFCPFEAVYFQRASSIVNNKRVKEIRKEAIELIWKQFLESKNYNIIKYKEHKSVIVAVPRTAESAAIHLSNYTQIPYASAIEKNPYSPRIFMQATQKHREIDTIANHYIYQEEVQGKQVILIDDSIVRGTTMKHDVKYLKDLGAKNVHLLIMFPPIRHPCMHGIDFHTEEELFSAEKNIYQMKKELGLNINDSLIYNTSENLKKTINLRSLCNECYVK